MQVETSAAPAQPETPAQADVAAPEVEAAPEAPQTPEVAAAQEVDDAQEGSREAAIAAFAAAMKAQDEAELTAAKASTEDAPAPADDAQPVAPAAETDEKPAALKPPEERPLSPQFAALKAEEKRIREMREALKEKEDAFREYEKAKAAAKANPLKVLEQLGLTYEQLTEHVLAHGNKPNPAAEAMAQVEALRAELAAKDKEAAARAQQAGEENVRAHIREVLKAKADTYEFAALKDSHAVREAYEALDAFYKEHGRLPAATFDASVEMVLQHVEEQFESEAVRYLTAKKLQAKLPSSKAPTSASAPRPQVNQGQQSKPKTLTNAQASVAPPRRDPDNLSREELIARAARILAGETA